MKTPLKDKIIITLLATVLIVAFVTRSYTKGNLKLRNIKIIPLAKTKIDNSDYFDKGNYGSF